MKKNPTILIVNDDGITANGIKNLVETVKNLGRIVVVAPEQGQSGMGHAITINTPLRITKSNIFGTDIEAYYVNGTPADCVKLAVDKILHAKPDICLSGINHGFNHAINVLYSGTMSAAMEAAIEQIPSIGFSLGNYSADANFTVANHYVLEIVEQVLAMKKYSTNFLLNVNIPDIKMDKIKGVKICRMANAKYKEDYDERKDPMGKKYYWLTGVLVDMDKGKDTDIWALKNNYVSIVPIQYDLTNYNLKQTLEKSFK